MREYRALEPDRQASRQEDVFGTVLGGGHMQVQEPKPPGGRPLNVPVQHSREHCLAVAARRLRQHRGGVDALDKHPPRVQRRPHLAVLVDIHAEDDDVSARNVLEGEQHLTLNCTSPPPAPPSGLGVVACTLLLLTMRMEIELPPFMAA
eukprot:CAMPEP_0173400958 /NCGR_PEP_ID=MMETSP1356-20130122/49534_1 /TAXON_ID=77927 ORGANISM="Hemiselmis virescens, Strain PCC157" /NCGR_SAMPLE_ID=MMETSP1356 /ASSEMBLY_ACC=CAM_ASM_000847 /LENGTH=148 /DNA_ID=CAMNT_0014360995 /DNA_START=428 /DNA_END=873 /DNA_ORIENTATION=+